MTDNNQSKSLLAKLLATENITMQKSASASTAYFDVKNRILVLPIWQGISNDLEDMLVVHEVGHALDTPLSSWQNAIERISKNVYADAVNDKIKSNIRGFLNVVEDARIDKRQKRRYPGSRRNYLIGYKELIDRDFFGTTKREINSFNFIDRFNMYFKGGFNIGIKFSPEEMPFVKKGEALETFAEVEALAEEIFLFCKQKGEEQMQDMQDLRFGEVEQGDDGEKFYVENDEGEEGDDGDIDTEDDAEEDEGDEGKGSSTGEGEEDADEEQEDGIKSAGSNEEEFVPESETEKAWQQKQSEMVANDGVQYHYVTVPKGNMKNIVHDYKMVMKQNLDFYNQMMDKEWLNTIRAEMIKFRNEDAATISYMVKEFEMKKSADIFSRISVAKTGVLDTNKIHSYKYNEDLFRRQSIIPAGKNHGFVMFLDWSGSMQSNIKDTVKQLMSLTAFCKRVQIPFEVYTFRDIRDNNEGKSFDHTTNDIILDNVVLRNVLSSRMKAAELIEAYTILWGLARYQTRFDSMNSTPLNSAIAVADEVVKKFKASSKAQIVNVVFLTDGDSNWVRGVFNHRQERYDAKGNRINNKYILKDKEIGKDYFFSNNGIPETKEITINLLKRLKDRTNCNLIGFYLHNQSSFNGMFRNFFDSMSVDYKYQETMKKSWSDNKFIPLTNQGYDEYYVLNTRAMANLQNDLNVSSDMTKAKIAKEFMKFSEKKSVNRVLLKRFIEKVA